jgi:hypothetical protein
MYEGMPDMAGIEQCFHKANGPSLNVTHIQNTSNTTTMGSGQNKTAKWIVPEIVHE